MSEVARRWSGLLVSVRDAAEAAEAVAGGAAIIDVKEPLHGALGAASAETAAAVAHAVGGASPWTLACGELSAGAAAAGGHVAAVIDALAPCIPRPAAAKAGPAGLDLACWRRDFATFAASLPAGVEAITVAYADWIAAAAPDPADIVAAAAALGCRTLLIDTFDKRETAPRLFAPATAAILPGWIARAHAAGMAVAVAGRLTVAEVARVVACGADVVAVRSAVCSGGRLGRVDRTLVVAAAEAATCRDAAPVVPA